MARSLVIFLAAAVLALGCARNSYRTVEPIRFSSAVPPMILTDVLARRAVELGYVIEAVDPVRGSFHVQSRLMGSRSRRLARGALRSNVFVVTVAEGTVDVRAYGRHVEIDHRMHPTLAQELEIFAESMQRTAQALAAASVGSAGGYGAPPPASAASPTPSVNPPADPAGALGDPAGG